MKQIIEAIAILTILLFQKESIYAQMAVHETSLEDVIPSNSCIPMNIADSIFGYFKTNSLFIWNDENNCEDRANAICILLDRWHVPNCKGWVLSGRLLGRDNGSFKPVKILHGSSTDSITWSHHITAAIPICVNNQSIFFVIDPATQAGPLAMADWANSVMCTPSGYYFLKLGNDVDVNYKQTIKKESWWTRSDLNYKYTMEGLCGYNGASHIGRKEIRRNQEKIQQTTLQFEQLAKPSFLPNQ